MVILIKRWIKNNETYELHFEPYYEDEIVLAFTNDKDDMNCFWYVSELLNVENDCIFADSIEETKEEFERLIAQHYEGQASYYDELYNKFIFEEDV